MRGLLADATAQEAHVRSQTKELVEKLRAEVEVSSLEIANCRARVTELESALAAVGSEATVELDELRVRLAQSETSGKPAKVQLEIASEECTQSRSSLLTFQSSLLLSSALYCLDDCIRHFQELLPTLNSFSVFRLEVITPLRSFVSDESDQTLPYSDVADWNGAKQFGTLNSHFTHAFFCAEMQVCLLCHYSLPSMLNPLRAVVDLAFSRLQCARFAVLSILDPHAPSLSRAVSLSVAAIEVRPVL